MEQRFQMNILHFLKALADESRLSMLGFLHEREHTVGELAERTALGDPTVSHHLARMREAGLVSLRMAGNQRYYRINESGLARFKRLAAVIEELQPLPSREEEIDDGWIKALGWSEDDQQVLREYAPAGRIRAIPAREKKLGILLRWLATLFQPDRLYSEVEVNELLKTIYEKDYVTLRRGLIDFGHLRREAGGGKYWLALGPEQKNSGGDG